MQIWVLATLSMVHSPNVKENTLIHSSILFPLNKEIIKNKDIFEKKCLIGIVKLDKVKWRVRCKSFGKVGS